MRLLSECHLSSQHRMTWNMGQQLGVKGTGALDTGARGSGADPTQLPDLEPLQDPALSSLRVVTQRTEMLCLPVGNESQLILKVRACRLPCFYSSPELGVPICGCTTLYTQV